MTWNLKLGTWNFPLATADIRPCPVCGGFERRVLHRQRFLEGPLGDGYDVVVCRHCGAGFADGIPAQEELDRYYAEQSKYTYHHAGGAESPYDLKRFDAIVEQVTPHLPSRDARILDIGCATGGLLSVFKQRGFANLLGADPSPACAEAARRLHGVEVRTATLAQLAGWQESFDLILLVGVLEHLRDVQPAVRTAVDRLNPGGLFYGAVPDVEGLAACRNAPYQQFSVEHVNFFSEQSLGRLMAVCGLAPRQTWRQMVEWREDITEPVLSGIYSLSPSLPHSFTPSHPSGEVPGSKFQVSRIQPPTTAVPQIGSSVPSAEVPSSKFQVPRSHPSSPSSALESSLFPLESERLPPPPDHATAPALQRYLAKCGQEDLKLATAVEQLVKSREPVLVWGAGTLTRRLLASSRLAEANIVAFVDSDPSIQGHRLAGRDILSPAQIAGRRETIVVCSKAFEREIMRMIRDELRLSNQVILLA
jgi:SAM-dependent methyltransferase